MLVVYVICCVNICGIILMSDDLVCLKILHKILLNYNHISIETRNDKISLEMGTPHSTTKRNGQGLGWCGKL